MEFHQPPTNNFDDSPCPYLRFSSQAHTTPPNINAYYFVKKMRYRVGIDYI